VHRQIAAVAVQVQDCAFDLDTGLGRQPPGVELEAVGRGQGDGAVFELGSFRGKDLARLGVKQQRTATAEGQEQAKDAEDSHPVKPRRIRVENNNCVNK